MDLDDVARLAALRESGQIETLESKHSPDKRLPWPGDRVRVRRLITYEGRREWVEETLMRAVTTMVVGQHASIVGVTLDPFPVVLSPLPDVQTAGDNARAQLGQQIANIIESAAFAVRANPEAIGAGADAVAAITELHKTLQAVHRLSLHATRPTGGPR